MKATVLAILLPLVALGQAKDPKYLVVKGRAEVQVPVEYVELSLSLTTHDSSFTAANDSSRKLIFQLFETLKHFGVADSDFQTVSNASGLADYRADYTLPKRSFSIYYTAILTLRNLSSYDSLFQALISLGNIQVSIKQFGSTQRTSYRLLAYQKAVDAARREAQMLLKGSHQSVGEIIKLIQDNRDVFTQYDDLDKILEGPRSSNMSNIEIVALNATVSTLRREYLTEQAEVTVIFSIK